ncbi:hypothetical protein [Phormidesmis priestleyi]|nr:hypothetical protein [Phormidesmis priestleyi]
MSRHDTTQAKTQNYTANKQSEQVKNTGASEHWDSTIAGLNLFVEQIVT